jgi:predicted NAD/FAD-binding protein
MRIGVVGAGAAGLVSAWLLQDDHDVVLVEAGSRPGGHAETVQVEVEGGVVDVELGPQFFFPEGYGGLHALLRRLGLTATPQRIRLTANLGEPQGTLVLPPLSLHAMGRLLNTTTLGQLYWFLRFGWGGEAVIREGDWSVSLQALVDRLGIPRYAAEGLIIPLVAANWGVSVEQARALSAYSVSRVMGMRPTRLPTSHTVPGGLGAYAHALVADAPTPHSAAQQPRAWPDAAPRGRPRPGRGRPCGALRRGDPRLRLAGLGGDLPRRPGLGRLAPRLRRL